MRRDQIAVAVALLSVGGALAACEAKTKVETSTPPVVPEDEAARTHREFKEALARRIDDIGRKLDDLKVKAQAAAADQKVNLQRLADELAVKKDEAAASLKELSETASEKWDTAKAKADRAVLDLEKKATEALNK